MQQPDPGPSPFAAFVSNADLAVLREILGHCPSDIGAVASTCRLLRDVVRAVAPNDAQLWRAAASLGFAFRVVHDSARIPPPVPNGHPHMSRFQVLHAPAANATIARLCDAGRAHIDRVEPALARAALAETTQFHESLRPGPAKTAAVEALDAVRTAYKMETEDRHPHRGRCPRVTGFARVRLPVRASTTTIELFIPPRSNFRAWMNLRAVRYHAAVVGPGGCILPLEQHINEEAICFFPKCPAPRGRGDYDAVGFRLTLMPPDSVDIRPCAEGHLPAFPPPRSPVDGRVVLDRAPDSAVDRLEIRKLDRWRALVNATRPQFLTPAAMQRAAAGLDRHLGVLNRVVAALPGAGPELLRAVARCLNLKTSAPDKSDWYAREPRRTRVGLTAAGGRYGKHRVGLGAPAALEAVRGANPLAFDALCFSICRGRLAADVLRCGHGTGMVVVTGGRLAWDTPRDLRNGPNGPDRA